MQLWPQLHSTWPMDVIVLNSFGGGGGSSNNNNSNNTQLN